MNRFANKTALIVGGSRGIGATVAKRLASEGADVAITYGRSADQANVVVKEIEAAGRKGHAVQADVGERGSADAVVASVIEAFGKIDILVITAGTFDVAPIGEIDDARFDKSFDVNVRGNFESFPSNFTDLRQNFLDQRNANQAMTNMLTTSPPHAVRNP